MLSKVAQLFRKKYGTLPAPFTSAYGFRSHSNSAIASPPLTNHTLDEVEYLPPYKNEKSSHSRDPVLHEVVDPEAAYSREDDAFSTAYSALLEQFSQYAQTYDLDTLREREFDRLRHAQAVYMDYMGACLYPDFLVREHLQALTHQLIGNTHSDSPSYVS
jgi:molybdenum cofactor sulfurtransferase